MRIWNLSWLFACGLLMALPANAQRFNSAGAVFQTFHDSPRVHSLGEATVALRGYAGASAINPATIGRAGQVQLSSSFQFDDGSPLLHSDWLKFGERELWIAAPYADVKIGPWAAAYQFKRFNYGEFEYRDAQNNLLGVYSNYDQSHKLTVARDFGARFSVGAGVNLIESKLGAPVSVGSQEGRTGRAFSVDLGAYYEHPIRTKLAHITPSVGWSLTDFGQRLDWENGAEDPLAMTMRGGVSVQAATARTFLGRPLVRLGLHGALSKLLVGGEREEDGEFRTYGAFEALVKSWESYDVRVGALNDPEPEYVTVSAVDQIHRHRGVELSLLDIASFRWGYVRENEGAGERKFSTFGWGLDLYYLALERSKVTDSDLDLSRYPATFKDLDLWRLTARVPLGGNDKDNFWLKLIDEIRGR